MTVTTAPRRALGAAAVAVALVLSACGAAADGEVATAGGDVSPAAAEDARDTAPLDEDAQALAFAECMREEGVDMPDPAPGQRGLVEAFQHGAEETRDRATIEQALEACQDLVPQYDHGPGHGPDEEMMLELTECLREQGLDVPDDLGQLGHDDISHDELNAAMEECRSVVGDVFGDDQ